MAIARFKDLCIDTASGLGRTEDFWAQVLGLKVERRDGGSWLAGATAQHRIWVNEVPEAKSVKNRVHLDVLAPSIAHLEALGARRVEDFERWTVMTDLDGQEFCAFIDEEAPEYRLKDVVVDSQHPEAIAQWWQGILGGVYGRSADNPWCWVDAIPDTPFESMDFVEVPEGKTVKNRVHWDVTVDGAAGLEALVAAGAALLRPKGEDIRWHVMADPDDNEFCAFVD
ncbi:VOC family protein [Jatrophihabitans sp. DSM 45814]